MGKAKFDISKFDVVKDGIWTFKPGYTVARNHDKFGIRMDMRWIREHYGPIKGVEDSSMIAMDFNSSGYLKRAFAQTDDGIMNLTVYEDSVKSLLDHTIHEFEEFEKSDTPLLNVKEVFRQMS